MFAKATSNKKFKKEIDKKWLITQILKALKKEKSHDRIKEFFKSPQSPLAGWLPGNRPKEVESKEVKDGRHGAEGRQRKEHQPMVQDDAMQVDGTEESAEVPVPAVTRTAKESGRQNVEKHHWPAKSPAVNKAMMKVVKEVVEQILITNKGETEVIQRQVDKGKARAMDIDKEPTDTTGEITVDKRSAMKKWGVVKSKANFGSDTDEGRSPIVDEQEMKVVKKEEFEQMMVGAHNVGTEGTRRRTDKGKGRAMEITVHKQRVPTKRAVEGEQSSREPVAGPSKVGRVNSTTRVNAEAVIPPT